MTNINGWMKEIDLWYVYKKGFTAMQRKVSITHWVGNTWATLWSPKYESVRKWCWEKLSI